MPNIYVNVWCVFARARVCVCVWHSVLTYFTLSEMILLGLLQPACNLSWPVTSRKAISPDRGVSRAAPEVLIGGERTLSGGEGLFALKFNGPPLLLVLQPRSNRYLDRDSCHKTRSPFRNIIITRRGCSPPSWGLCLVFFPFPHV